MHAAARSERETQPTRVRRPADPIPRSPLVAAIGAQFVEPHGRAIVRLAKEKETVRADAGVAVVLQRKGEKQQASELVSRAERALRALPHDPWSGFTAARIDSLQGDSKAALSALRRAERAGARSGWRYARDIDPVFESIRHEPEFKAIFYDIERDMARQRAELAKRPKDAPLDLGVGK